MLVITNDAITNKIICICNSKAFPTSHTLPRKYILVNMLAVPCLFAWGCYQIICLKRQFF